LGGKINQTNNCNLGERRGGETESERVKGLTKEVRKYRP